MLVVKVLNNNAFISRDNNGEEIIVMGRGVGFKRKEGDDFEPELGYKIFSNTEHLNEKMKDVILNIPESYIELTQKVVAYFEKTNNTKLHHIIYISLTEHIHSAVERYKNGIQLENPLLNEIKRFYKVEYEVALYALELINEELGIAFKRDEAGYIAQHIVNAELNDQINNVSEITNIVKQILNVVRYNVLVEFDEESIAYDRFVTHLKYFAQRILTGSSYCDEEEFFETLKRKYKRSYECTCKIKGFIEKEYDYKLTESEQMYLMVHIERVCFKTKR